MIYGKDLLSVNDIFAGAKREFALKMGGTVSKESSSLVLRIVKYSECVRQADRIYALK